MAVKGPTISPQLHQLGTSLQHMAFGDIQDPKHAMQCPVVELGFSLMVPEAAVLR